MRGAGLSESDKAQLAMDRLFDCKEPQIIVDPPGHSGAKPGLNVYTQALAAANTANAKMKPVTSLTPVKNCAPMMLATRPYR